jgi:1-acyl-sn-glycerol-3-phosphate acyltransferase
MLSDKLLYWASKPIVMSYTGINLRMRVKMPDPFPEGAKIIAANHPSTTDPFFVAAMLRQQTYILINDLLFQVPILGEYLRRSGHIPVKAGNGQAAIQTALDHLKSGHTIIIFPEGDLSPLYGGFHKARTGVARLALLSGAPVITAGIHLNWKHIHLIRSTVKGRAEMGRWYLRGPYNITVGQPMRFYGDVEDRAYVRVVADKVMHQIIELARDSENNLNRTSGSLVGALEMP